MYLFTYCTLKVNVKDWYLANAFIQSDVPHSTAIYGTNIILMVLYLLFVCV